MMAMVAAVRYQKIPLMKEREMGFSTGHGGTVGGRPLQTSKENERTRLAY